jgi:hypothetical protein
MVGFDTKELNAMSLSNDHLNILSSKYKISKETFLVKVLQHIGCIICLPSIVLYTNEYLIKHFSRLVHPFVSRKTFVSANKIISLQISGDDIEEVISFSELEESKNDEFYLQHSKQRSALRILSFDVDNKKS